MLFRRQAEQVISQKQQRRTARGQTGGKLEWWDLSLIGTGAVIGAGFFLGTALSIQLAGPSIVLAYVAGGITAYLVFRGLAEMSVNDPQHGSFRVYARKGFGPYMGFVSGWMYWLAGVFIMSTEVTALAIFTRLWLPHVPLWILAAFYSALALAINLLGVKDFGRIESLFGVIKTSSLVIFIILGLFFIINGTIVHTAIIPPASPGQWFPHGLTGLWSAMIFVLFSYGGIEVMGILSQELKNTREIGPAGRLMLIALTSIYSLALLMVVLMVPWQSVNTSASPFITALLPLRLGFIDSLLNAIIISAAFSTMVGALFAVTNILVSLAEDEDAPLVLARRTPRGVPVPAMSLTATGLLIAIIMSFLLPATVYEYLATAAGVMLILNWIIILGAQIKNRPAYMRSSGFVRYSMRGYPLTSYLAIGIIVLTISGALLHPAQRIGVLVSLVLAAAIYFISRLPQIHGKAGLQASPARKKFPDAGER